MPKQKNAATRLKAPRVGNRERIIEAAIELMNIYGSSVGTAQIADHTGISPGSLYYHFRDFSDIALVVFDRMRTELAATLAMPPFGAISAPQLVGYYSGGAQVLWRYRFAVSAGRELTSRNSDLTESYRDFTLDGIEAVRCILDNVFEHHPGGIRVSKSDCALLAENSWVLWSAWPRHAETKNRSSRTSAPEIAKGLKQVAMTIAPYLDRDYYDAVNEGLITYVSSLEGKFD